MVALDVGDLVHGTVPGKGNSEVIPGGEKYTYLHFMNDSWNRKAPQGQDLPALVSKVIDELAVLPILSSQHLFQLKNWSVNGLCSMPLERGYNLVEDLIKTYCFLNPKMNLFTFSLTAI